MGGKESALRLGLGESDGVGLDALGLVLSPVRVDVMRKEVSAVDHSSFDGLGVASTVVFEGRLSKVGSKRAVGDPPGGVLELYQLNATLSIRFCCYD